MLKLCKIHTTTAHVSLKLKPDTSFLYANKSKAKLKMFFPPERKPVLNPSCSNCKQGEAPIGVACLIASDVSSWRTDINKDAAQKVYTQPAFILNKHQPSNHVA